MAILLLLESKTLTNSSSLALASHRTNEPVDYCPGDLIRVIVCCKGVRWAHNPPRLMGFCAGDFVSESGFHESCPLTSFFYTNYWHGWLRVMFTTIVTEQWLISVATRLWVPGLITSNSDRLATKVMKKTLCSMLHPETEMVLLDSYLTNLSGCFRSCLYKCIRKCKLKLLFYLSWTTIIMTDQYFHIPIRSFPKV